MNPVLKNILVAVAAAVVGSIANMSLVILGGVVVPPPAGYDLNTMEGLAAAMPQMQPMHFLFPFLAHAVGTLVGALIVARFAASRQLQISLIIGSLFFVGGLQMVMELPSPMWFNVLDLGLAYFPMALLAHKLGRSKTASHSS
jgi:hypothetical protein